MLSRFIYFIIFSIFLVSQTAWSNPLVDYEMEKMYLQKKQKIKREVASNPEDEQEFQEAPLATSIYEQKLESTYSNEFIRNKFRKPVQFPVKE